MFDKITIYGGGLIGSGWTTHLICCGISDVTMYDISEEALNKAKKRIENDLTFLVEENVLSEKEANERMKKICFTTDRKVALAEADLVQENCPENMDLKQRVMVEIEEYCKPETVISTSTSGMSVTQIGAKMKYPQRLVGAHPYHPVYLLPLVELVRGSETDEKTLNDLKEFYRSIRKEPVVLKKECPGYIASRLMSVLFRESTHLIQSGVASMEDIDTAFTYGPGMRYGLVGINMTLQLAGGDYGLNGALFGGIGTSGGNWLESFANFTEWPDDYKEFWQTCQNQMNKEMSHRDDLHGKTNAEIQRFRDQGLIQLLKCHGKM